MSVPSTPFFPTDGQLWAAWNRRVVPDQLNGVGWVNKLPVVTKTGKKTDLQPKENKEEFSIFHRDWRKRKEKRRYIFKKTQEEDFQNAGGNVFLATEIISVFRLFEPFFLALSMTGFYAFRGAVTKFLTDPITGGGNKTDFAMETKRSAQWHRPSTSNWSMLPINGIKSNGRKKIQWKKRLI